MSAYNARRAPNVSQYIANLNTIPSAADAAAPQDFGNFDDDDLALFTNTQFFDFDMNESVPKMAGDMPVFDGEAPRSQHQTQPNLGQDVKSMNFVNRTSDPILHSRLTLYHDLDAYVHHEHPLTLCFSEPHFQFTDFPFTQPQSQRLSSQSIPPSPSNGLAPYQSQHPTPPLPHNQPAFVQSPIIGDKRKSIAASISSPADYDDQSRGAADEDKRRRNTAASARFRVKKKQREQALEKSAKDMSDKVQYLEARVGQLEMENKWLKGLITEKNLRGPVDVPSTQPTNEAAERSTEQRKDGVGTKPEASSEVTV